MIPAELHHSRKAQRNSAGVLLLFIFFLSLAGCSTSSLLDQVKAPPERLRAQSAVNSYANELLEAAVLDTPGSAFSAVLVDDESDLWTGSAGAIGEDSLIPVTPDTPMPIGSITKIFTALAVMQLAEQGKIDLEAPFIDYIPGFSIQSRFDAPPFTIRQMLSHYSGLPSDLIADWDISVSEVRHRFNAAVNNAAMTHMKSPPDYAHSYSNLAYQLLGILIQRVSGESYETYLQKQIFHPLGMHNTAVLIGDRDDQWPVLNGSDDPGQSGYILFSAVSAGAIVSTANDMGRFMRMLLAEGEGIVSASSFREMLEWQGRDVVFPDTSWQGLGFSLSGPRDRRFTYGHGGSVPPFYSSLVMLPEQGLGMLVLQSSTDYENLTTRIGERILDAEENALGMEKPAEPSIAHVDRSLSATRFPQELRESFEGHYFSTNLGMSTVKGTRKGLSIRLKARPMVNVLLDYAGDNRFIPRIRLGGFTPLDPGIIGNVGSLRAESSIVDGKRFLTVTPSHRTRLPLGNSFRAQTVEGVWLDRVGTFRPEHQGMVKELVVRADEDSNLLFIEALTMDDNRLPFPVEVLSESQVAVPGTGRYSGEVIEFVNNDQILFGAQHFYREDAGSMDTQSQE